MELSKLVSIQQPNAHICIFKSIAGVYTLNDEVLYDGLVKDFTKEELLDHEIVVVSGANDQECGVRIWID